MTFYPKSNYLFVHSAGMDSRELLQALLTKHRLNPTSLAKKVKFPKRQSNLAKYLDDPAMQPRINTMKPFADFFKINVQAFYDDRIAHAEGMRLGLVPTTGASKPADQAKANGDVKVVDLPMPVSAPQSVGEAFLRVVAAFRSQDQAVRAAAAELAADAIRRPNEAERLSRKLEALVDDIGDESASRFRNH